MEGVVVFGEMIPILIFSVLLFIHGKQNQFILKKKTRLIYSKYNMISF